MLELTTTFKASYVLLAACQPVLALLKAFNPIYKRGDNFVEVLQKISRLMCYSAGGQKEQGKTEKDEGGHTPQSNQNRDFGAEMPNNCRSPIACCRSEVCACRPGPHRLQRLVEIISPGERKHTHINYLEIFKGS